MMRLLIDAGNTRIKWATVAPGADLAAWAQSGVLEYDTAATKDAAEAIDPTQLALAQWQQAAISAVWISNVAGNKVRQHWQTTLQQGLGPAVALHWFASSPMAGGLKNGYREPGQLGCDRFAAAIAARARYPARAILVANCGTATTLDAISPDGCFIGGMILPGLLTMTHSLKRQTAQLPEVTMQAHLDSANRTEFIPQLANHTDAAIISGCITAQIGAIDHALCLLRAQFGDTLCILSGGAAQVIGAAFSEPHQVIDHLVLQGLQVVADFHD